MTNHTITFYHFPLSPPSRAALLVVRALGIRHNLKIVNLMNGEQNSPEFLKVPVIFENIQPSTEKAKNFEEYMQLLDQFLDNEKWVAGENLTIADFSIITVISTAEALMFQINKYPNISAWYKRAQDAMTSFGYDEVNKSGVDEFGNIFKTKLKQWT